MSVIAFLSPFLFSSSLCFNSYTERVGIFFGRHGEKRRDSMYLGQGREGTDCNYTNNKYAYTCTHMATRYCTYALGLWVKPEFIKNKIRKVLTVLETYY